LPKRRLGQHGGARFANRLIRTKPHDQVRPLDQRTVEAAVERRLIAALVEHFGDAPTAPQMILITRAARMTVRSPRT
jgi:hypothetical protein